MNMKGEVDTGCGVEDAEFIVTEDVLSGIEIHFGFGYVRFPWTEYWKLREFLETGVDPDEN
jgi:hypothetical protein